jgi:hypothetical protein
MLRLYLSARPCNVTPSARLDLLRGRQSRRIGSRSTSANPPNAASISRPVPVLVSAHGSVKGRNYALASAMRPTMPNKSKVLRASRSMRVIVTMAPRDPVVSATHTSYTAHAVSGMFYRVTVSPTVIPV